MATTAPGITATTIHETRSHTDPATERMAWERGHGLWQLALLSVCVVFPWELRAEPATTEYSANAFFTARVIDADTGETIASFIALAGTSRMNDIGWQWQPHTICEFRDGRMQWPPPGSRGYQTQLLRVEAEGYMPYHTPLIKQLTRDEVAMPGGAATGPNGETMPTVLYGRAGEPADWVIRLQHDPGTKGRVLLPGGQPAAGAQVAIAMARREVRIADGTFEVRALAEDAGLRGRWARPFLTTTDLDGRFQVPSEIAPAALIVTHAEGIAAIPLNEFVSTGDAILQPWGAIDGRVMWGDLPGSDVRLHVGARTRVADRFHLVVGCSQSVVTDDQGRFRIDRLPPGLAQVSHAIEVPGKEGSSFRPVQFVDIAPGEPTLFVFGGRGRPVIGKLAGTGSFQDVRIRIAPNAPHPRFLANDQDSTWSAYTLFLSSPAGKNYVQDDVKVNADGTFRIENVPPETYQLFVTAPAADGKAENIGFSQFTIETIPGGVSEAPHDVGEIHLRRAGDTA